MYTFLLISKTFIISALILSPRGNTSLHKTEKPFHSAEREINITPIPVLYKKNFTKLPVWDFEDVYLRDHQARKPVSAPFPIPFSRHGADVKLFWSLWKITFSVDLSKVPSKRRRSQVQGSCPFWYSAVAIQRSTQHDRMESISTLQQSFWLHGVQLQWWSSKANYRTFLADFTSCSLWVRKTSGTSCICLRKACSRLLLHRRLCIVNVNRSIFLYSKKHYGFSIS